LVGRGVVGRGDHVPRLVEVAGREAAQVDGDLVDHALDGRGDLGGYHVHVGAGSDEGGHATLCDVAATDDHHLATGQPQAGGVDLLAHDSPASSDAMPALSKVAISVRIAAAART